MIADQLVHAMSNAIAEIMYSFCGVLYLFAIGAVCIFVIWCGYTFSRYRRRSGRGHD